MQRVVASLAGLVALAAGLCAENHALLIAVPDTPHLDTKHSPSLEGPSNDVVALRRTLVDRWGFRDDRIQTLDGSDSTRAAILASLDRLADEASSGDYVLVYFSGHGTSAFNPDAVFAGLRRGTGALVPADMKPGTAAEMLDGLVVGSRDLRPRFERLDRSGAETLVLFDTCYAGDSAKSIPRLFARSTELFPRRTTSQIIDLLGEEATDTPWPYERVVYISASARHELARDIRQREARATHPTLDGLAHGAFTDGLLRGLRGDADRDRDGQIVYSELQEYLVGRVVRYGQTPQLRPRGKPVIERPVFGRKGAPERPLVAAGPTDMRIRIEPPDVELSALLERQDGVVLTTGMCDLEVRREPPGHFRVYAAGADLGVRLTKPAEVADLLHQRVPAQRIANLRYPAQDMRLAILVEPEQGVYDRGDQLEVGIRLGEAAWLLVLAIDAEGGVVTVYPLDESQAQPVGGTETVRVVQLQATAPYGTDLLEAFAFREKPDGYDEWVPGGIELERAEKQRLYAMLRRGAGEPGRARASRIVFTRDR